jgi:predicted transcriptional regulator
MAMNLRLSDEETRALHDYAEAHGRSMQDVARVAIREYVTERSAKRSDILKRIVDEDAALLDLLAQ